MVAEFYKQEYSFAVDDVVNRIISGSYAVSPSEIGIDLGEAAPINGEKSSFVLWIDVYTGDVEMTVMTAQECITEVFFLLSDHERDTIIQKVGEYFHE